MKKLHSVNYSQDFWKSLAKGCIISLWKSFHPTQIVRSSRPLRAVAVLKKPLIYSLLLLIGFLLGRPSPIVIHKSLPPVKIQLASAIKTPSLKPIEALETALHTMQALGTYSNDYAPGNCTWLVASRLPVPNSMGNANVWDDYLGGRGYTISNTPKVGAIAQTDGDSWLGHVALVTGIDSSGVLITEMNAQGYGIVDTRYASPGEFKYIYF